MEETWKSLADIVECGTYYEISNIGNIRSIDRIINQRNAFGNTSRVRYKGKTLKQKVDKDGYLKVNLSLNGKVKSHIVHRLVALAFINNPDNKPEVNHKDGNKSNNDISNLEWCTVKENLQHAHKTGLKNPKIGVENGSAKLTDDDVRKIREMWSSGEFSQVSLSKLFNVSRRNIQSIIFYETWRHVD